MRSGASARTGFATVRPLALFALMAAGLVALVFATPFNHDEDQYLAASVLAAKAMMFRDFLYVQTPLQPWLTAPVAALAHGWSFLALRGVSAALGLLSLAGVWTAVRGLGATRSAANAAVGLTACCYVFQFCSSVFRNDALPTALLAWAIVAAAHALREDARVRWLGWAACGLLLAGATSAKVSFAPLLAGVGLVLLVRLARRRTAAEVGRATGFGVGAAAGLAPIAFAWASSPVVVRYALVDYWAGGPQRWYLANGLQHRMEPLSKLLYGMGDLALGPALAALVVVGWSAWVSRAVPATPALRLLDVLILAALIAAFIPSPTYKQYFAALLPPLFVRLGVTGARPAWSRPLLTLGVAIGVGAFGFILGQAAFTGRWTPVQVMREARWVGRTMEAAHAHGVIATLSPHVVLDSGLPLDPRFAAGAMVYRSADGVAPALRATLHLTSPRALATDFDAAPPAALLVGYEGAGGDVKVSLDQPLRAYAIARGYAAHRSPFGAAELYIRPAGGRP